MKEMSISGTEILCYVKMTETPYEWRGVDVYNTVICIARYRDTKSLTIPNLSVSCPVRNNKHTERCQGGKHYQADCVDLLFRCRHGKHPIRHTQRMTGLTSQISPSILSARCRYVTRFSIVKTSNFVHQSNPAGKFQTPPSQSKFYQPRHCAGKCIGC